MPDNCSNCGVPMAQIDKCIEYVRNHPEVRDVLLSGGDALMVGDSLTSDVKAANNAGMDACWYNPSGKAAAGSYDIRYTITDISEAAGIALGD